MPPAATSSNSSTNTTPGGGGGGRKVTQQSQRSPQQHNPQPSQSQPHRRGSSAPVRPSPLPKQSHPPTTTTGKFGEGSPPLVLLGGFGTTGGAGGETLSDFVLATQLPTASEALRRARESLRQHQPSSYGGVDASTAPGGDDTRAKNGCRHLLVHLPDRLDATMAQCRLIRPSRTNSTSTTNVVWVPANPVHALHLASQLDSDPSLMAAFGGHGEGATAVRGTGQSSGGSNTTVTPEPVLLYGEEQQRLLAWQTEGVPEEWLPWIQEQPPPPPPPQQPPQPLLVLPPSSSPPPLPPPKPPKPSQQQQQQQQQPLSKPSSQGPSAVVLPPPATAGSSAPESVSSSTTPAVSSAAGLVPSTGTLQPDSADAAATAAAATATTGTDAAEAQSSSSVEEPRPPPEVADTPLADPVSSGCTVAPPPPLPPPPSKADDDDQGSTTPNAVLSGPPNPAPQSAATVAEAGTEDMATTMTTAATATAVAVATEIPSEVPSPPEPVQSSSEQLVSVPEPAQSSLSSSLSVSGEAPPDPAADPAKVPSSTEVAVVTAETGAGPTAPPPTAYSSPPLEALTPDPATTTAFASVPMAPTPLPPHRPTALAKTDVAYNAWRAREELVRLLRRAFLAPRGGSAAAVKRRATPPAPPNSAASAPAAAIPAHPPKKKRKVGDTPSTATTKAKGPAAATAALTTPPPAGSSMAASHASPTSTHHPAALRNLLVLRRGGYPGESSPAAAAATAAVVDARQWAEAREESRKQVYRWIFHFRLAREAHWREKRDRQRQQQRQQRYQHRSFHRPPLEVGMTFGVIRDDDGDVENASEREDVIDSDELEGWDPIESLGCVPCSSGRASDWSEWNLGPWNGGVGGSHHRRLLPRGDQVLHCLDCLFVGCAPAAEGDSADAVLSREHILQHMLTSNHNFAVTCGPQAKIYCFKCGDFVRHEIFDQEKERIDVGEMFPWMGWKDHPVQRSFDALRFMRLPDQGVVWSGMFATYPPLVPPAHVRAARLCMRRQLLFQGSVAELPDDATPGARDFTAHQSQQVDKDRFRPAAPVGMYNLGNTCFMSAILQCLVHVPDLLSYFLKEVGHNHLSCGLYKAKALTEPKVSGVLGTSATTGKVDVCLACELDKVFLQYFGSAAGFDVMSILRNNAALPSVKGLIASQHTSSNAVITGEPLVTAEMLTAAWNCGGMGHLAGYDQRDAHEFLHGFLEFLGKDVRQHRERVHHFINIPRPANSIVSELKGIEKDAIKTIFEGTLRSVLLCGKCGSKRIQSEPFMSLSLPLTKEVQVPGSRNGPMSVERCLRYFITPETLADPVDCPTCREKTPTTKQHVVSRLPKVLCLHLKRFDAAHNKKIEDFVEFPVSGLNMGPFLPHWCEVTRGVTTEMDQANVDLPSFLYDLIGTVNHFGTLQSGHYVANVKNGSKWYHCNDAHVSLAGEEGDGSNEVGSSSGAYLLFYIRR